MSINWVEKDAMTRLSPKTLASKTVLCYARFHGDKKDLSPRPVDHDFPRSAERDPRLCRHPRPSADPS